MLAPHVVAATPEDGCVASIMRNMSWGASEAQPLSAAGQMPQMVPMAMPTEDFVGNKDLMQELHIRAAREAALAVGMSPSAAMAAMPLLPAMPIGADTVAHAEAVLGSEPLTMPSCSTSTDSCGQPEQLFTCTVCRKVFKREMNLIFHMTTHRPRQPEAEPTDSTSTQPVKCQDCGKEFATKYQAKKHFLRRHFQGEKPFACTKCNKKRFVVKEDLTMHMKARPTATQATPGSGWWAMGRKQKRLRRNAFVASPPCPLATILSTRHYHARLRPTPLPLAPPQSCGNVYVCNCGIRLCSLGALKRHCKYFGHAPESLEPQPDPVSVQPALGWNGFDAVSSVAVETHSLSDGHPMHGLGMQSDMPSSSGGMSHPALAQTLAARYAAGLGLNSELAHKGQNGMVHRVGSGLSGLGSSQHEQALSAALASYQGMARLPGQQLAGGRLAGGGLAGGGGPVPQGLLSMGRADLGAAAGAPGVAPYPVSSADEALPSNWPHMLNGMIPSLAHVHSCPPEPPCNLLTPPSPSQPRSSTLDPRTTSPRPGAASPDRWHTRHVRLPRTPGHAWAAAWAAKQRGPRQPRRRRCRRRALRGRFCSLQRPVCCAAPAARRGP